MYKKNIIVWAVTLTVLVHSGVANAQVIPLPPVESARQSQVSAKETARNLFNGLELKNIGPKLTRLAPALEDKRSEFRSKEKHEAIPDAQAIKIENEQTYYVDWQRKNSPYHQEKKNHALQPIGGIIGCWVYFGEVLAILPWLTIGSVIGVGSKTTFGLGQIYWSVGLRG